MNSGEPRWLTTDEVLDIHRRALDAHGGLAGVRDQGGLEMAVSRPQQFYAYEGERDVFILAALYAEGIMAHTHPFLDGNKRTGFTAAEVFLRLNGWHLPPTEDPEERIQFFERVAAGDVGEGALSRFYRAHAMKR